MEFKFFALTVPSSKTKPSGAILTKFYQENLTKEYDCDHSQDYGLVTNLIGGLLVSWCRRDQKNSFRMGFLFFTKTEPIVTGR